MQPLDQSRGVRAGALSCAITQARDGGEWSRGEKGGSCIMLIKHIYRQKRGHDELLNSSQDLLPKKDEVFAHST
jgi:hypothetical protein